VGDGFAHQGVELRVVERGKPVVRDVAGVATAFHRSGQREVRKRLLPDFRLAGGRQGLAARAQHAQRSAKHDAEWGDTPPPCRGEGGPANTLLRCIRAS